MVVGFPVRRPEVLHVHRGLALAGLRAIVELRVCDLLATLQAVVGVVGALVLQKLLH